VRRGKPPLVQLIDSGAAGPWRNVSMCGDSLRWRGALQERLNGWPGWQFFELPLLLAQQERLVFNPGVYSPGSTR
jgi:hypothetical protein